MTAKKSLQFLGVSGPQGPVNGVRGHDGKPPRLILVTPAGHIREVALTRTDLTKMIEDAAKALQRMDREEQK